MKSRPQPKKKDGRERDLPPIHPGEQLREEFMIPANLSARRLAKDIGVSVSRVQAIVKERHKISADTALRLAHYFGTTAELWMNMQRDFELANAEARARRAAAHPVQVNGRSTALFKRRK